MKKLVSLIAAGLLLANVTTLAQDAEKKPKVYTLVVDGVV